MGVNAAGWQTGLFVKRVEKALQSPDIQSLHMRAGTQSHSAQAQEVIEAQKLHSV